MSITHSTKFRHIKNVALEFMCFTKKSSNPGSGLNTPTLPSKHVVILYEGNVY